MERINYKHLYYFWMVAREGGVSRACAKLHLAQPTVSGQLAAFERALGEKLFLREGHQLKLTDTGRLVFRYAEEIFSLGQELKAALKKKAIGKVLHLTLGVVDALPKLVAYRIIYPVLRLQNLQIRCYEGKAERLLADLSLGELDLVLSDVPMTSGGAEVSNHLLWESGVSAFAISELARHYRPGFPHSLVGAPFLLPTANTALRRSLDQWFEAMSIQPQISAEIEDSALLKTFGSSGVGLFVAPTAVENEICRQYRVEVVGRIEDITERFYAITRHGRFCHPAVAKILEQLKKRELALERDSFSIDSGSQQAVL